MLYYPFFKRKCIRKSFCNVTQKKLARRSANLYKLIHRNFKQNIILSNKSGAKSKTDHEKAAAWLHRIIQTILGDTNADLKVIQNNNENESFEDNVGDGSDKDLTMIPKMIMNLIMQMKKIR